LDVTSDESVAACVAKVMNDNNGRPVDIVINNAGYGVAGYLESVHINEAKDVFDVNVWGAVRVLQALLPGMRKKGGGYVINISSTSGIRGIPCFEYYTGTYLVSSIIFLVSSIIFLVSSIILVPTIQAQASNPKPKTSNPKSH
jgi:NADP-dependent 3-hydroxy acid dehydrogenase YdfG